jgi:hypothetical protein
MSSAVAPETPKLTSRLVASAESRALPTADYFDRLARNTSPSSWAAGALRKVRPAGCHTRRPTPVRSGVGAPGVRPSERLTKRAIGLVRVLRLGAPVVASYDRTAWVPRRARNALQTNLPESASCDWRCRRGRGAFAPGVVRVSAGPPTSKRARATARPGDPTSPGRRGPGAEAPRSRRPDELGIASIDRRSRLRSEARALRSRRHYEVGGAPDRIWAA